MQTYSVKEIQLLVKDAPVVPAEIQPFVGIQFRRSSDIFRAFKETGLHAGGKLPGGPPGR